MANMTTSGSNGQNNEYEFNNLLGNYGGGKTLEKSLDKGRTAVDSLLSLTLGDSSMAGASGSNSASTLQLVNGCFTYDFIGKNFLSYADHKGNATFSRVDVSWSDKSVSLIGNLTLNQQGVISGAITSLIYSDCSGNTAEFDGRIGVAGSTVQGIRFTSAHVTVDDGNQSRLDLTGVFTAPKDGDALGTPDGVVSAMTYTDENGVQLRATGLNGLHLGDILDEHSVDFGSLLSGNDTITAMYTSSNDGRGASLAGHDGNDTLIGGDNNDYLNGGSGNDTMTGGKGDDTYTVDSAKDKIVEAAAASGGDDSAWLQQSGSFSTFKMATGLENAYVSFDGDYSGSPGMTVIGNALNNIITGGYGDDVLNGGAGNDLLEDGQSGSDNDTLNGGIGDDVLIAGGGLNTLTGGKGADMFVHFADGPALAIDGSSLYGDGQGIDTITDFQRGADKLVLNINSAGYDYNYTDSDSALHLVLVDGAQSLAGVGRVSLPHPVTSGELVYAKDVFSTYQEGDGWVPEDGQQLASQDFHRVSGFDAYDLSQYTHSGIYYDTSDGDVWYVAVRGYDDQTRDGDNAIVSDTTGTLKSATMMATIVGQPQFSASDIVLVDQVHLVGSNFGVS